MNCHRLVSLLSAYIDGELTGVEMIEIRRHLDGCRACQDELDDLRAVKRLVGRLQPAQPSVDLPTRICARLDQVQPYSLLGAWTAVWRSSFQKLSPAVAAVAVVFLGMLLFTAQTIDERLTARNDALHYAPLVSTAPTIASPASASLIEQRPLHTVASAAVFPTRPVRENTNRVWIEMTGYSGR